MFKHILVALDGSPSSEQALKQALVLARLTSASLTALSVEEKLPAYAATVGEVQDAKQEIDAFFAKVHASAQVQARAAGVKLTTVIHAGHAARTIVHFAGEGGFDLIVLGAGGLHGLGSTADKVVEAAPCSVLTVRALPLSVRVSDVMSKQVATASPAAPLADVVELLLKRAIKAVPVVEGGRPIGIVTGGDLLRRANLGLRLSVQRKLPPDDLAEQLHQLEEKHLTAQDIMTKPVVTIRSDARVSDAVRLMNEKHLKRLPVVDDRGILVGIISRTDVLAAYVAEPVSEEEIGTTGIQEARTVSDVMFRDVPTVDPEATLDEVLAKIVATPLRRVVVIDESQRVLGIIVDADLLLKIGVHERASLFRALLQRLSLVSAEPVKTAERAADLMSTETFAVSEDTALAEVLRIMLEKHVKRLVVTDAENHLLGMVDRRSLLQVIGSELGN